ncbi:MAG TPA: cache domain-containing protein [Anaeromyxobacteraceae bacterium]
MAWCVLASGTAFADEKRGTADEAVAMVTKATAYITANGKDKAFGEFNNPAGQFVRGDLYITVYDLNGTCLAHGFNKKMVGKNMIDLKDVDGKPFVKDRNDLAKTKDTFWLEYKYVNPTTKAIEKKAQYTQKVGDVLVCCGIYKS